MKRTNQELVGAAGSAMNMKLSIFGLCVISLSITNDYVVDGDIVNLALMTFVCLIFFICIQLCRLLTASSIMELKETVKPIRIKESPIGTSSSMCIILTVLLTIVILVDVFRFLHVFDLVQSARPNIWYNYIAIPLSVLLIYLQGRFTYDMINENSMELYTAAKYVEDPDIKHLIDKYKPKN